MRTEVSIIAHPRRSPRVRSVGGLAVRRTGATTLHLIGTAATPLGGDHIIVTVEVHPGAELELRTVAATIALPSRERPDSEITWHIDVGAGGRLWLDPEPTVVAAGAVLTTSTTVTADREAAVVIAEHVQLGRVTERERDTERARWEGALHVDVGGRPMLRHRLRLFCGHGGGPPIGPGASDGGRVSVGGGRALRPRAVSSVFCYPEARPDSVSSTALTARLGLVGGGSLTTALAESAAQARRSCDLLDAPLTPGASR